MVNSKQIGWNNANILFMVNSKQIMLKQCKNIAYAKFKANYVETMQRGTLCVCVYAVYNYQLYKWILCTP